MGGFIVFLLCVWFLRAVLRGTGRIVGGAISAAERDAARREKAEAAARKEAERAEAERRRIAEQQRRIEAARIKDIERRERELQREAREKERHDWQREKMEWARQKELDRRYDLEQRRKRLEQIDKERKEQQKTDKAEQARRIAKADLDFIDQSLSDLTPLVDQYRETFENTVTDKTKWNAYKKLYQLEARQNRLDKQRMKALYTIQGGA